MTEETVNKEEDLKVLEGVLETPTHSHKVCRTLKEVAKILLWVTSSEVKVTTGVDESSSKVYLVEWKR